MQYRTRKRAVTPPGDEPLPLISGPQQCFIEALLVGKSVKDGAQLAGVSTRSAFYWLEDPTGPVPREYERLRVLQSTLFEARIARLHDLAFAALEDLLSPNAAPMLRFQAAKLLYESHLQRLCFPRAVESGGALLTSGLEQYQDEQMQSRSASVLLYDARNRPRLPEDD